MKRLRILLFVLPALLMVAILVAGLLFYFSPHRFIQWSASLAAGREVTIGEVQVTYRPFRVQLKDVHVANAPWAKEKDMLRIGQVIAEPDMAQLISRRLLLQRLEVEDANLFLERDAQGKGNWKSAMPSLACYAARRSGGKPKAFSAALELIVKNSRIEMRTARGNILQVGLNNVEVRTADISRPITITADGAYNDIPVQLSVHAGSYEELRAVNKPFPAIITAKGAGVTLDADLQMMDPVNFDQFSGNFRAAGKNTGKAAAIFNNDFTRNVPFKLQSDFKHEGDAWRFDQVKAVLPKNPIVSGHVYVDEGAHTEPDRLELALGFDRLRIESLLKFDDQITSNKLIHLSGQPSILLKAELSVERLSYHSAQARDVSLHAHIEPNASGVEITSPDMLGSKFKAAAGARAGESDDKVYLKAELPRMNVSRLLQSVGANTNLASGEATGSIDLKSEGSSWQQWAKGAQGAVHLSMLEQGKVARSLIQTASADLHRLLGADPTLIPVSCMIAEVHLSEGQGTLEPFLIDTEEGRLLGAGTLNLFPATMDFRFQTDPKTTGGLALDIPVHISGPLDNPKIAPGKAQKIDFSDVNECPLPETP